MNLAQAIDGEAVREGRIGQFTPAVEKDTTPHVSRKTKIVAALRGRDLSFDDLFIAIGGGNRNSFSVDLATLKKSELIFTKGQRGRFIYSLERP